MFKDLKKNFQIVKYVFKFCPMYIFYTIIYIICNTIQVLGKVYLIREVVTLVEKGIKENTIKESFKTILIYVLIYTIVVIIASIGKTYYVTYVKGYYRIIYISKIRTVLYNKAKTVDFADFDNPEFYDTYSRALRFGINRGIKVYEDFTDFFASIINTLALGTFIIISDVFLIGIVLISVVTRIIIANKVNKNIHEFDTIVEKDRRMYGYVNRTFYQQRFAAEIKTTSIGNLLIEKCQDAQDNIDRECINTYKRNTLLNSCSTVISNIFENGGMYIYLVYKLFHGLEIAKLSSMINAASQFSANFYQAASFFSKIKANAMYIDYFLDYMNYVPKLEEVGEKVLKEELETLEIKNVDFKYSGVDYFALSNINLKIRKGEKIAMVGLNGAGKTTIIKLLLKFYNPDKGDIYFNNQTIRETKESDIREKYSIIFQDFRIYGVSIGENILMRKVLNQDDEDLVWDCLAKVKLKDKIATLPNGIHTMYSREFGNDCVALSGGEQQRLAIARVFASNASIYILDEPTSSLDPLAEKNINDLLMEEAKDKTIIIIAHRLSTVVDADRIILLEYGKIIEEGTHNELLKKNGRYKEMFTTQATLYVRDNNSHSKGKYDNDEDN